MNYRIIVSTYTNVRASNVKEARELFRLAQENADEKMDPSITSDLILNAEVVAVVEEDTLPIIK